MTTWKFVIVERSVYYVDLDTDNPDIAYDDFRGLVDNGDVQLDRPDEYENDEFCEISKRYN